MTIRKMRRSRVRMKMRRRRARGGGSGRGCTLCCWPPIGKVCTHSYYSISISTITDNKIKHENVWFLILGQWNIYFHRHPTEITGYTYECTHIYILCTCGYKGTYMYVCTGVCVCSFQGFILVSDLSIKIIMAWILI